jgi:competence protein ComEC
MTIYTLNVRQADTSVIKTPGGRCIVIDAVKPDKLVDLIDHAWGGTRPEISLLVLTHPHNDHYTGANRLLNEFTVRKVILAPFWNEPGTTGYHTIINRIHEDQIPVQFLAGYERVYPDADSGSYPDYSGQVKLELLGPPNHVLEDLAESRDLTPNHLSVMARLSYGSFNMVFAADAQMENWAHFDREGMLEDGCSVLKAAHHGSKRGTQWERLERLAPEFVIVSSDPDAQHHLPDLIGAVTFLEFDESSSRRVALTHESGTVRITVQASGSYDEHAYGEASTTLISQSGNPQPLADMDWLTFAQSRMPTP